MMQRLIQTSRSPGEARRRVSEACKILNLLPQARLVRLLDMGSPAGARHGLMGGGGGQQGPSKYKVVERCEKDDGYGVEEDACVVEASTSTGTKYKVAQQLGTWLSRTFCDTFSRRFGDSSNGAGGGGGLYGVGSGPAGDSRGSVSGYT